MNFGLGELYSVACALAWAIAIVLFKKSGESLAPFALNLFKNALGLVLMAVTIVLWQGAAWPSIPTDALLLIAVSGVLGIAAGDTLYFRALNAIGASRVAVAQTLYSPFVIGLSALFLGERLNLWQFGGVALVLAGILLVTHTRGVEAVNAQQLRRGAWWAIASVFLMAVGVVISKPLLERYDFLWVVMLRIAAGLIGMLLLVAWRRNAVALWRDYQRVRHWPQVIAGAFFGTYVSMLLWLAGYKYTDASIAAVLNEFTAVFVLPLAVWFLHERVQRRQVVGVALALAGVGLVVSL